MNKLLPSLLAFCVLLTAAAAERISLGSGQSASLTLPATWTVGELPGLPPGMAGPGKNLRYVTKSGSNDSVMITFVPLPDTRLANAAAFKEMVDDAAQRFVPGSVEGKVRLKEFSVGRASGYAATFTDASLVGQPPAKENYKVMTACFVYLGNQLLLSATIFTDDLNGKAYGEALQLLKSISVSPAKDAL